MGLLQNVSQDLVCQIRIWFWINK